MNTALENRTQPTQNAQSGALKRPCPVCGNSSRQNCNLWSATPDFEVLRCRDCSGTFINEIVDGGARFSISDTEDPDPSHVLKAAHDFVRVSSKLVNLEGTEPVSRSLLDIGCGAGCFLREVKQAGWHETGIEPSPSLVSYARDKYGLNVTHGSIEAPTKFPDGSFDVITMFGVIEHLAEPCSATVECARLLRPRGILILQTPSEDGLVRRTGRFLYWVSGGYLTFQVNQLYQLNGGHSVCFNRRSLQILLNRSGFELISFEQSTYGFRILLHRFKHLPFLKRIANTVGTLAIFCIGRILGSSNHVTVYARKRVDKGLSRIAQERGLSHHRNATTRSFK